MNTRMKIVPVGGRVKTAGMGIPAEIKDAQRMDAWVKAMKERPSPELLKAFFPATSRLMKQRLRGPGLYRPFVKTDQGMPGCFMPFFIDTGQTVTDMTPRTINLEEGVAVPEPWANLEGARIKEMQQAFHTLDLREVFTLLSQRGNSSTRRAQKGRTEFFLIRAAMTNKPVVFGSDMIATVEEQVNLLLSMIYEEAAEAERQATGQIKSANLLYCQPDVYILTDGTVVVERINCPDVGMFLNTVSCSTSTILSQVHHVIAGLTEAVVAKLAGLFKGNLYLLTRDEVIDHQEDLLEIGEMKELTARLAQHGITAIPTRLSDVNSIPSGASVLLLNIDYQAAGIESLFARHHNEEIDCYPNPYFQRACRTATGIDRVVLPDHKMTRSFLDLAHALPKTPEALIHVMEQIDQRLTACNMHGDLLHVEVGRELIPVVRQSKHAWRQVSNKVRKCRGDKGKNFPHLAIRSLPATRESLLISSDTGSHLNVFRFMCI